MSNISDGDLALQGSLGSLSLSDLTPHGDLYRERFTTRGGEALIFNIHKYVQNMADVSTRLYFESSCHLSWGPFRYGQPDPYLERECDIKVSLQMASVQYVHTQRFQADVVAFIQHFTQLQDVLGRQRAAVEGQAVSSTCCEKVVETGNSPIFSSPLSFLSCRYGNILNMRPGFCWILKLVPQLSSFRKAHVHRRSS